jgi:MFS family permease
VTNSRRNLLPWLVWGVAALAYAVAIVNRSSLAALGLAAQEHFSIDATTLASFAVIQLLVYAAMQVPVGVLLDRFGSTALILTGGLLMMLGQIAMATVHEVWLAILARILVGAGDACAFISVIRMLPEWFAVRQLPIVAQLTALIGQAGQLVSVTPLALVVDLWGWSTGFMGIAAVGFLVVLLGLFVLRDQPGQATAFERMTGRVGRTSRNAVSLGVTDTTAALAAVAPPATTMMPEVSGRPRRGLKFWSSVRRLASLPGVRLAYWVHFTTPFSVNTFVLLWGTPFLISGLGFSAPAASGLLSLVIASGMLSGLLLGPLTSRFVETRVTLVITVAVTILCAWLAVLLWPGVPPTWLVIALLVIIAVGGPTSMIAFEVSRSHLPRSFAGFGTGLVNTAGFTASLLVILCIGLVLDAQGAGSPENYSLETFRWAFAVQLPVLLLGIVMMLIERRRTARWMHSHGRSLR